MRTPFYRDHFEWGADGRQRVFFALDRIVATLFGALYLLLGTRFLLDLFEARKSASFYETVRSLSQPFYRPFEGLFTISRIDGHPVAWSLLVAIVAYMVLHAALRSLLHFAGREA